MNLLDKFEYAQKVVQDQAVVITELVDHVSCLCKKEIEDINNLKVRADWIIEGVPEIRVTKTVTEEIIQEQLKEINIIVRVIDKRQHDTQVELNDHICDHTIKGS